MSLEIELIVTFGYCMFWNFNCPFRVAIIFPIIIRVVVMC